MIALEEHSETLCRPGWRSVQIVQTSGSCGPSWKKKKAWSISVIRTLQVTGEVLIEGDSNPAHLGIGKLTFGDWKLKGGQWYILWALQNMRENRSRKQRKERVCVCEKLISFVEREIVRTERPPEVQNEWDELSSRAVSYAFPFRHCRVTSHGISVVVSSLFSGRPASFILLYHYPRFGLLPLTFNSSLSYFEDRRSNGGLELTALRVSAGVVFFIAPFPHLVSISYISPIATDFSICPRPCPYILRHWRALMIESHSSSLFAGRVDGQPKSHLSYIKPSGPLL